MTESVPILTDEQIRTQAREYATTIQGLTGVRGKSPQLYEARRKWVQFLQSLGKNSRRTIARNAYWEELDKQIKDG